MYFRLSLGFEPRLAYVSAGNTSGWVLLLYFDTHCNTSEWVLKILQVCAGVRRCVRVCAGVCGCACARVCAGARGCGYVMWSVVGGITGVFIYSDEFAQLTSTQVVSLG